MLSRSEVFIGGRWTGDGVTYVDVVDPATGQPFAQAPLASTSHVDEAVAAAKAALPRWAATAPSQRVELVEAASRALEKRLDDVLMVVTQEMGLPITASRALHGVKALSTVAEACEVARAYPWEEVRGVRTSSRLVSEPVGVVASIAPWNGPFLQALYKIVYPLLAGCPVVYKPAPETPLDAFFIAEAFQEAGLPDGLLSIVPGGRETGEHLVAHRDVDAIFFTGSTAAGRRIGGVCGTTMKRAVLELGGKSAAVVLPDADLGVALPALVSGAFGNSGQNCAATSRILVPEELYDEVAGRLVHAARALRMGPTLDPETDLGPVINQQARDRIEGMVAQGIADGAERLCGGERPALPGYWVAPTILGRVDNASLIAQEEIFGPVATLIEYDGSVEEAIRIANDSPYGLHGSVFTQDLGRAEQVARSVRSGTFSINCFMLNSEAPFGGTKLSGVGRKYGREGLSEFLEVKTINEAGQGTFGFAAPAREEEAR